MVAPVPALPRSREPLGSKGLARATASIAKARSHCFTCCLSVWLFIVVLGLCATSTRSFRACGTGLHPAATETAPFRVSCSTFSELTQHQQHVPLQRLSQEWASSADNGGFSRQHAASRDRNLRTALAAISLRMGTWLGNAESASRSSALPTPATGILGVVRLQAAAPTVQMPSVRSIFESSALFSSSSADRPACTFSIGGAIENEGGTATRRTDQEILGDQRGAGFAFPTANQLLGTAQETACELLPLSGFQAKLKSSLESVLQILRASRLGTTLQELAGSKGAGQVFRSAKAASAGGKSAPGNNIESALPLQAGDGSSATCNPGCVSSHDTAHSRYPQRSTTRKASAQARMDVHLPDSAGSSEPIGVDNPSSVARDREWKDRGHRVGFISPNGVVMQGLSIEAKARLEGSSQQATQVKGTEGAYGKSGAAFLLPLPGEPAQNIVDGGAASGTVQDSSRASPTAAQPQGLTAEPNNGQASGPMAFYPAFGAVAAPPVVSSDKRSEYAKEVARVAYLSGKKAAQAERSGEMEPRAGPAGSAKSITSNKPAAAAERGAIAAPLQRVGHDNHAERDCMQPKQNSLQPRSLASTVRDQAESHWEEPHERQRPSAMTSDRETEDQGKDAIDLPTAGGRHKESDTNVWLVTLRDCALC